jgi:formamidopyrimidine-DNA glycosylase
MPELPEVETIRRRLDPNVVGRTIVGLEVFDARVSEQPAEELRRLLVGARITASGRRGKWLTLTAGENLIVIHLRMTGQMLLQPGAAQRGPRWTIDLDDGQRLWFYDQRRFGTLEVIAASAAAERFADLGIEPLCAELGVAELRAQLAGRTAPLKAFLLDQRRLAGVGNIYADEALFRARLHPLRKAGSVGPREAQRLHAAIVATLELAIEHEGSSIESFVDPAGERGRFQEILNVYQRTGEPCRVCATPIKRAVVSGRGTHFCPRCQPRRYPRALRHDQTVSLLRGFRRRSDLRNL